MYFILHQRFLPLASLLIISPFMDFGLKVQQNVMWDGNDKWYGHWDLPKKWVNHSIFKRWEFELLGFVYLTIKMIKFLCRFHLWCVGGLDIILFETLQGDNNLCTFTPHSRHCKSAYSTPSVRRWVLFGSLEDHNFSCLTVMDGQQARLKKIKNIY